MKRQETPAFRVEELESRRLLSALIGGEETYAQALGPAAKGGRPPAPAPEIRLDLVAVHEFGHSLGLGHSSDSSSIMYAYYNKDYDLTKFANDPAATAFANMYSATAVDNEQTPWKDALDGNDDGLLTITYSFVHDGAIMDGGNRKTPNLSNLFSTFDDRFGVGDWEGTFASALDVWASVTNGIVTFQPFDAAPGAKADGIEDGVYNFGATGSAQHNSRFGDIRIAAHKFDGPGKVLGHTYYPPPNGGTAAGDSHYDFAENWLPGILGTSAPSGDSVIVNSSAPVTEAAAQSPFSTANTIEDKNDVLGVESSLFA